MDGTYLGYDRAALDRQYDNRSTVANPEIHLNRRNEFSERARKTLRSRIDVPYGPGDREDLDIFPSGVAGGPTLIFIHGGFWRGGDKSAYSFVGSTFVPAGISVVTINYPLAPDATLAEIVGACRGAVQWVHDRSREWNGDPERIFVSGHSAGGHLASMLATSPVVKGVAAVSGIYDLEPIFRCGVNDWARLQREDVEALSPLYDLPSNPIPLIAAVGGNETDEFRRQNKVLADAWRQRGYPLTELVMDDHNHFTTAEELADPAGALSRAIVDQIMKA